MVRQRRMQANWDFGEEGQRAMDAMRARALPAIVLAMTPSAYLNWDGTRSGRPPYVLQEIIDTLMTHGHDMALLTPKVADAIVD